ncbi:hypothetical protein VZT92_005801 [Zoarces viviparus]|uniref:Reverse transcriptase n=1 Tax=Zoarces viviparus TaxID=48416 RepID=A0AAW1FPA2_ZOAVI
MVCWVAHRTIKHEKFKRAWQRAGGTLVELPELGTFEDVNQGRRPVRCSVIPSSSLTPKKRLVPCDWRQVEFDRWASLGSQGKGIREFEDDKISNCCLSSPVNAGFRPGQYTAALQLRANVYPTQELCSQGRASSSSSLCRYCRGSPETCSHILGVCPQVRQVRIRRHHKVCEVIATEAGEWTERGVG